jgi:hypothetical protein
MEVNHPRSEMISMDSVLNFMTSNISFISLIDIFEVILFLPMIFILMTVNARTKKLCNLYIRLERKINEL